MPSPSVSVVMCTYNGAAAGGAYLRAQLDSILAQTYPIRELIISDDGSTDDTWSILTTYAAAHPCISLFRNPAPLGVNSNFFATMRRATSDYILLADQDDIWLPAKIEHQLTAIADRALCIHPSYEFYTAEPPLPPAPSDLPIPNLGLERCLFERIYTGHTMLMTRAFRDLLLHTFPDDAPALWYTRHGWLYDALIGHTAALYDSVAYLHEPLVLHRRHPGQVTAASAPGTPLHRLFHRLHIYFLLAFARLTPEERIARCYPYCGYDYYAPRFRSWQHFISLFPTSPNLSTTQLTTTLITTYLQRRFFRFRLLYLRHRHQVSPYRNTSFLRALDHALRY